MFVTNGNSPTAQSYSVASRDSAQRGERGLGLTLVITIAAVLGVAIAAGVTAFLLLREEGHLPEQTAKFLPAHTQFYFSVNLRPGNDQLRQAWDIQTRFREHPEFQEKIDDLFDQAKDEAGIDLKNDVLPWLGPELAVAVIDVVGSAVAGTTGGAPLMVALVGTRDSERSAKVLEDLINYQREEEDLKFDVETYRTATLYSEQGDDLHYAATEHYVLFATDRDLLEQTIDRIQDSDDAGSLYTDAQFQKVRYALENPRVFMLYLDSEAVWKDARRQAGEQVPTELRRQLDDLIPEWVAMTGSFIDRGFSPNPPKDVLVDSP